VASNAVNSNLFSGGDWANFFCHEKGDEGPKLEARRAENGGGALWEGAENPLATSWGVWGIDELPQLGPGGKIEIL